MKKRDLKAKLSNICFLCTIFILFSSLFVFIMLRQFTNVLYVHLFLSFVIVFAVILYSILNKVVFGSKSLINRVERFVVVITAIFVVAVIIDDFVILYTIKKSNMYILFTDIKDMFLLYAGVTAFIAALILINGMNANISYKENNRSFSILILVFLCVALIADITLNILNYRYERTIVNNFVSDTYDPSSYLRFFIFYSFVSIVPIITFIYFRDNRIAQLVTLFIVGALNVLLYFGGEITYSFLHLIIGFIAIGILIANIICLKLEARKNDRLC